MRCSLRCAVVNGGMGLTLVGWGMQCEGRNDDKERRERGEREEKKRIINIIIF